MHSVLMDDACILKTHVFMQRWCDIAIVVFIIKSPHLAYSVDNRQHSTSATLNIGLNIGFSEHRNNRPSEQSAKCNIGQALSVDFNFNFLCGRPHGGWTPSPVHMRPPEPDTPLRVDVINGRPLVGALYLSTHV